MSECKFAVEAFHAYIESIGLSRPAGTLGELKAFKAGADWQRSLAQAELAALNITSQQLRERVAKWKALAEASQVIAEIAQNSTSRMDALKSAPVVMPERRHIDSFFRSYKHDLGWNACLDKFESLNRSKT